MKIIVKGMVGLMGLVALGLVATPKSHAEDGVIIYRAEDRGAGRAAKGELRPAGTYSYTQRAYQGTLIYYGEGTNRNPNVYSSRVVSFYVTFDNPTVIHAGHAYGDVDADKRDTRTFPRRLFR